MKQKTVKSKITETKIFDFTKIKVLDIKNETQIMDVSKLLGNIIYNTTPDIAAMDHGRTIFHTGKTELTRNEMNYFQSLLQESKAVPAPLKEALIGFFNFE